MQALPFIMAAGTAVGVYGEYQASKYQSQVAENNAKLLEQNMARETFAANQDMMDKDLAARSEMAQAIADMGASGLNANSGSMLLRRRSLSELADRDRERLGFKRDTQLENNRMQVGALRADAKAQRNAGKLGLVSGLLKIGTSYLSGASSVKQYNTSSAGLSAPSYQR